MAYDKVLAGTMSAGPMFVRKTHECKVSYVMNSNGLRDIERLYGKNSNFW